METETVFCAVFCHPEEAERLKDLLANGSSAEARNDNVCHAEAVPKDLLAKILRLNDIQYNKVKSTRFLTEKRNELYRI